MRKILFIITIIAVISACSKKTSNLQVGDLTTVMRTADVASDPSNTVMLDAQPGSGMAIIDTKPFESGTIHLELKGENTPGRSFVGLAFNIQNDTTYEAIYFRPFNFQSGEEIRRSHSIQYIYEPKYSWNYLRTNFEGKYEADYPRQPNPDEWFAVSIEIGKTDVVVFDASTKKELLRVDRLEKQKSNKIGFWVGNGSKGGFRNLRIE